MEIVRGDQNFTQTHTHTHTHTHTQTFLESKIIKKSKSSFLTIAILPSLLMSLESKMYENELE